ncbi:MAG: carboxypeptidase regulatory-like domain-containing protein [Armatimonadetes bacterium]|nr:carboxypeptidase regulatory-like domain-containing protein [Armatimonadota bacterium]
MKLQRRTATAFFLTAALGLAACSGGGGGGGGGGNNNNGGGGGGASKTLTVVPNQASVEPDSSLALTASTTNVSSPRFSYLVVAPQALGRATAAEVAARFGSVDPSGVFTAPATAEVGLQGSVRVTETTAPLSAVVPIMIVPPVLRATVSPSELSLLAGQTAQFSAEPVDFLEQPILGFLVDWRVIGGVGTIDKDGTFHAATAGVGAVQARIGGADVAGAQVTVVGSVTGLSIRPLGNPVQVEAGTTRRFRAFVSDAHGNTTEVPAAWDVSPAAVGTVTPAGGVFTAGAEGQVGTLRAQAQGQTATLPILVVAQLTPPTGLPTNVNGTVRDSNGPVGGVTVTVKLESDGSVVDQTVSAADGKFSFFLPAGTYRFEAAQGNASAARGGVVLPSQDAQLVVDLTLVSQ